MCKGPASAGAAATATEAELKAKRKQQKQAAKEAAETEAPPMEEEEDEEAAARAARKAAKRAAKQAQAVAEEAAAEGAEEDEAAARKAAKKAAKKAAAAAAAAAEEVEEEEEDAAEAERRATKLAKKKAKAEAKAQQDSEEVEQATPMRKRKDHEKCEEQTPGAVPEKKKRKGDEGGSVALSPAAFREANEIVVPNAAASCPDPFQTFAAAEPLLGPKLAAALRAQGFERPTPIQAQAWPIALSGRDMVAVAKTGSGKTCGFLLPALARIGERGPAPRPKKMSYYESEPSEPSVLVLAPTRELAQQIAAEAERFASAVKAKVVTVYGGVPKGDQLRALRCGCDVLIATPGRLLDLAGGDTKRGLNSTLELTKVTYLVLDEADRMLDMGFEPDIRKIVEQCPETGKPAEGGGATGPVAGTMRQTLFFTATWPKDVQETAASLTSSGAVQVRIGQGADGDKLTANKNVTQRVEVMEDSDKPGRLVEVLKNELKDGETAIIFASQKNVCDDLERDLQRTFASGSGNRGLWCRAIHSGKDQWVRDEALAKFRELTASSSAGGAGGKRGALVATDVAARGLDIPGVALVIVYDFGRGLHANGGVESYVHRIGRTGRAGRKGRAVTFFTDQDNGAIELIELLKGADQEVPAELLEISTSESSERWNKDWKKSFYKKGSGRFGGKGKGKGKGGGGKGKGKGKGKGRGSSW